MVTRVAHDLVAHCETGRQLSKEVMRFLKVSTTHLVTCSFESLYELSNRELLPGLKRAQIS